jgi:hypothetical protein
MRDVERAEAPQLELVLELGEAHQDEREERLRERRCHAWRGRATANIVPLASDLTVIGSLL